MVAALSINGLLFIDAIPPFRLKVEDTGELGLYKNLERRRPLKKLNSHFSDTWRLSSRKGPKKSRKLSVVNELGGQYEDTFNDVKTQILNCFTFKAVRTVLAQLYEMNPSKYMWLYNFSATTSPSDGKRFLQTLVKENQELAERVMVTRLHLYGKWIKKCDHGEMYKEISDENLELMRERLLETIVWPADDPNPNTEKMDS